MLIFKKDLRIYVFLLVWYLHLAVDCRIITNVREWNTLLNILLYHIMLIMWFFFLPIL